VITALCGTNGALTFQASVSGIAIYLDNFAIKVLAKDQSSLRQRFITAVQRGADLLFSTAHAVEIVGPLGGSSDAVKKFLDDLGPHWYPVEFLVFDVVKRESEGASPDKSCFAGELLTSYFASHTSGYHSGSGKVIDLSERFFRLGNFVDWLAPERDSFRASCAQLDSTVEEAVGRLRAKAKKDPSWLDKVIPQSKFDPSKAATFAVATLMRNLVSDRGYRLKKGDGIDFCHAVMASSFANFATLDKQWKRRVEGFPKPNRETRIYYEPELGLMMEDIEAALDQLAKMNRIPRA
jgi:hypothetical protein